MSHVSSKSHPSKPCDSSSPAVSLSPPPLHLHHTARDPASHPALAPRTTPLTTLLLTRHTACGLLSILSVRTRTSASTTTSRLSTVHTTAESTLLPQMRNMTTICSRAACWTDAPPRMAPVIVPGIAMMPITLCDFSWMDLGTWGEVGE